MTQAQIITIVIVVLVVLISLALLKSILRWFIAVGAICIGLVYFGIATPKQIQDVASQIKNQGIETYQKIAETSENIRIKDNKLQVKVDTGKWLNMNELDSIIKDTDKELVVTFDGKKYKITDKNVKDLIKSFK